MAVNLYAGDNTIRVTLTGLKNESSGAYINDATVTCTIYTASSATEVTGETWPVSLTAAGSGGDYAGAVSADSVITAGSAYTVKMNVTSGTNKAEFQETVTAKTRGF